MDSVGVRELRQRSSELLRRVERGETIEVTDRGRPVAVLAPLPRGGGIAELRATGQLEPATAEFATMPEPLTLPTEDTDDLLTSGVLAALRRDER